jgi:hypothetical protein
MIPSLQGLPNWEIFPLRIETEKYNKLPNNFSPDVRSCTSILYDLYAPCTTCIVCMYTPMPSALHVYTCPNGPVRMYVPCHTCVTHMHVPFYTCPVCMYTPLTPVRRVCMHPELPIQCVRPDPMTVAVVASFSFGLS